MLVAIALWVAPNCQATDDVCLVIKSLQLLPCIYDHQSLKKMVRTPPCNTDDFKDLAQGLQETIWHSSSVLLVTVLAPVDLNMNSCVPGRGHALQGLLAT